MKNIFKTLALSLILALSVNSVTALEVSGKVLYHHDDARPIGNVIVILKNADDGTSLTCISNYQGYYVFPNVPNGNFVLTGDASLLAGGVTYYDPSQIYLFLTGQAELDELQKLAADVDKNGTINWNDYNLINSHILYGTAFPAGTWRFETIEFSISDFKDGVPKGIGGTCSGDVGGGFIPAVNNTPALLVAQEGTMNISKGEAFTTRLVVESEIITNGTGIIVNYPSELLKIESVEFAGTDFQYFVSEGQIRLIWGNPSTTPITFTPGEALITIHGTATDAFNQGMAASFTLDSKTSILNTSNEEIAGLRFSSPVIQSGNPSLKLSNYPNPFTTSTRLSIYTPEEGNAIVEVYNASGQLVQSTSAGMLNAGNHEIGLDATLLAKGYYVCKLRIQASGTEMTKAIRILKAE